MEINPNWVVLGNYDETPYESVPAEVINNMTFAERKKFEEEKQAFFTKSRLHGLNDSVYPFALGGSDAAIVYGISHWTTPIELYRQKNNLPFHKRKSSNEEILQVGHDMEPIIRNWFSERSGFEAFPFNYQIRNKKWKHLVANIDGLVETPEGVGIYEGKTTSCDNYAKISAWKKGIVPQEYLLQCYFYMAILELPFTYITCSWGFGPSNMVYVRVERLPEAQEVAFMNGLEEFVTNSEKGIPPTNQDVLDRKLVLNSIARIYKPVDNSDKPQILGKEFESSIRKYLEIQEEKKSLSAKVNALEKEMISIGSTIASEMKENTRAVFNLDGVSVKISYDSSFRTSINKELLKEKYPDVYEDVYTPKETQRTLKISKEKGGRTSWKLKT